MRSVPFRYDMQAYPWTIIHGQANPKTNYVGKAKVKDASANTKAKAKDEKRKKCPSCEMKKKRTYAYEADGIYAGT